MKVSQNKLKPSVKLLLEEFVYNAAANANDSFVYLNKRIATVEELELTQDEVYKTAFYNDSLYKAIIPRNAKTAIHLYAEDGSEISSSVFKLERDYGAIVFDREPSVLPVKCKAVIYCAQEADNVLALDGSNTMADSYEPSKDQSVVTKKYLENELNSLQAGLYTLSSLTVKQGGKELPELLQYSTSEKLPVVFLSESVGTLNIVTNSFIIERTWNEDSTKISLVVDGSTFFETSIKDVMEGNSSYWKLNTSKNIFETDLTNTYWLNSYIFNCASFTILKYLIDINVTNPSVLMAVKVKCGDKEYSAGVTVGIDTYKIVSSIKTSIAWSDARLQTLKTHYVSGIRYFDSKEKTYELPITFTHCNEFLKYYRPSSFVEMGVIYDGKYEKQVEGGIDSHIPYTSSSMLTSYEHQVNITLRVGVTGIYFKVYDVLGNLLDCVTKDIDCTFNSGEEKYRVYTPSADTSMPDPEALTIWDSEKTLEGFEPSLVDDTYILTDESNKGQSAICFKYESNDPNFHYSHADIDIEHNGQMYIRSGKSTNWLDCQKYVGAFDTPTEYKEACKLGEGNSYTFGKVVYTEPLYVRILGATSIKMNSISPR